MRSSTHIHELQTVKLCYFRCFVTTKLAMLEIIKWAISCIGFAIVLTEIVLPFLANVIFGNHSDQSNIDDDNDGRGWW